MSDPTFYGDVDYVVQWRRDPKYKFADVGHGQLKNKEEALAYAEEERGGRLSTHEYRVIMRATQIVELEV